MEDLYRPYKKKRMTKAGKAKEQGLEPLANKILEFDSSFKLAEVAPTYINQELGLETVEEVLEGVHEILAEYVGDDAHFREWIRSEALKNGLIEASIKDETKDERKVYEMYYEFKQKVAKIPSHQVLALNRAEKEEVIKVDILLDEDKIMNFFARELIKGEAQVSKDMIRAAYEDAYKRFIKPSIDREVRNELTEKSEDQAIEVFGENLKNLLLQSPLKNKVVLGFDPAFRTGCKLAVVDEFGDMKHTSVIYPHNTSDAKRNQEKKVLAQLIKKYNVDLVAIGNGTASRESEFFVAEMIKEEALDIAYLIVDEAGASVYSASQVARDEFPDLQVEMRSAISIARRIQDPLAELVKIDPKSVGVGQYQHDLPQKKLDEKLSFIVEMVVNQVGVDVNTASASLLTYISGLSKTTAQNLINYRQENGGFTDRKQIKKVKRFGPKTYEQAIGFLRVNDGKDILDKTSIHPESYDVTEKLLQDLGSSKEEIGTEIIVEKLNKFDIDKFAQAHDVGKATLLDIINALKKPDRDIRDASEKPQLRMDVLSLEDLKEGMILNGTVRNVVDFGAFVDLGVGEDGLVHISELSSGFVKHPSDVVSVGDVVKVSVKSLDIPRRRIGLSMKN
ncbi:MAG TPA: Tex family protein [Erysipelothrix sp.]